MTAWFQSWGASYEWSWFLATIIGILVIALPLMLGWARGLVPGADRDAGRHTRLRTNKAA